MAALAARGASDNAAAADDGEALPYWLVFMPHVDDGVKRAIFGRLKLKTIEAVLAMPPPQICRALGLHRDVHENVNAAHEWLHTRATIGLLQPKNHDEVHVTCSDDADLAIVTSRLSDDILRTVTIVSIDASGSEITGASLRRFRALTFVERLNLDRYIDVGSNGLHHALSNLRSLNLSGNRLLLDYGLADLSSIKTLRSLRIDGCVQITDEAMRHIAAIEGLQQLSVSDLRLTHRGFEHLANGPAGVSLEYLDAAKCGRLNNECLKHIARLRLQHLNVSACSMFTGAGLSAICDTHPASLRVLNLTSCSQINDSAMTHVARLTSLQRLVLHGCRQVSDTGISRLVAGKQNLTSLCISDCGSQITDVCITLICDSFGGLRHLSLARLLNITDACLAEIGSKLAELRHLNITFCHLLSGGAKAAFKKAHPECEFVDADD